MELARGRSILKYEKRDFNIFTAMHFQALHKAKEIDFFLFEGKRNTRCMEKWHTYSAKATQLPQQQQRQWQQRQWQWQQRQFAWA